MPQHTQEEEWRDIPGFEGRYEVSDHGNVRSLDRYVKCAHGATRMVKSQPRRATIDKFGYEYVDLYRNDNRARRYIHSMVLTVFGRKLVNGEEVRHKDNDPLNNHISNLHWGSRSDNTYDQVIANSHNNARKTHCKRGHPFTTENTKVEVRPSTTVRICRTCERERSRRGYRRRKAA